jgi:hypothetical protein
MNRMVGRAVPSPPPDGAMGSRPTICGGSWPQCVADRPNKLLMNLMMAG